MQLALFFGNRLSEQNSNNFSCHSERQRTTRASTSYGSLLAYDVSKEFSLFSFDFKYKLDSFGSAEPQNDVNCNYFTRRYKSVQNLTIFSRSVL